MTRFFNSVKPKSSGANKCGYATKFSLVVPVEYEECSRFAVLSQDIPKVIDVVTGLQSRIQH